jgi:hypothetical protein
MTFENEKSEAGMVRKARMMRSRSELKQNQVGLFSITLFYPRAYVSRAFLRHFRSVLGARFRC